MKVTQNSSEVATEIEMVMPLDGHQHFRDRKMLELVAPMIARRFYAAIAMPNLDPPVTSFELVKHYQEEILDSTGKKFKPLMTMYLTDTLDPSEVRKGIEAGLVFGVKYYPRGVTTNSENGVEDPTSLWKKGSKPYEVLRVLADLNAVFLIHGADGVAREKCVSEAETYHPGQELDPYTQEAHFVMMTLPHIRAAHTDLKISFEHLSTALGAEYIREHGGEKLGCSLTLHHLTKTRADVYRGGYNTHLSWRPPIQSALHMEALRDLATQDLPFVWLGSDSAPHPRAQKEAACCKSGVLTAHMGIEGYVEAFEDMGMLDERFERFASINGPHFFGIEPSTETIKLVREEWTVTPLFWARYPDELSREVEVVPFRLGEKVRWRLAQ